MTNQELQQLRREYSSGELDESTVLDNPFKQFTAWFKEAVEAEAAEPNAMTLATVDQNQKPDARIVLLKEMEDDGFVFYTNYASDKGRQIEQNPNVSLCFFWVELERQVRINGKAQKIPKAQSEKYFKSRPYKSQLGAWVSNQSEPVESRAVLERKFEEAERTFSEDEIPMPENWGGYKVIPERFEFWQGRRSRLHDRIRFDLENGAWLKYRLCP